MFGWFADMLLGLTYSIVLLGLQAACGILAAYCIQDALLQYGMDCPWEACVAMASGHPIAFLAFTQTWQQWPRQDVPMVVSMLLCVGWHAPTVWDCHVLSGAAALALMPSADMDACLLMLVLGAFFPAFPPSEGEENAGDTDDASASGASQESWWQDLDDDVVSDHAGVARSPAEQEDADMKRAMQESLRTTSDRHAELLAEVGDALAGVGVARASDGSEGVLILHDVVANG